MTAELIPDELELEASGQLTIGVVGEQRAFAELAPEGKPAPIEPTGLFGAEQELERRREAEELAPYVESTRYALTADDVEHGYPRANPNPKRYPCAICGRLAIAEELCYSHHTRQRYCPLTDAQACQRRAERATPKES